MKKAWLAAMGAMTAAVLLVAGCTVSNDSSDTTSAIMNAQNSGIWINAEGKVLAAPDLASITLGIEAVSDTASKARIEAAVAMSKVIQALHEAGVAAADIQTRHFSIQPQTRWAEDKREEMIIGYLVSNTVTAHIRLDPQKHEALHNKASHVIDAVAGAGGNMARIQGIRFSIENPEKYRTQARKKAFVIAKSDAKELAGLAGLTLGQPTYITEEAYSLNKSVSAYEAKAGAITPISPGEQEITVHLRLRFNLDSANP